MRRPGPGIGGHLARGGCDGPSGQQLRLRQATTYADWQLGRTHTPAREAGQESLDRPILERVERDGGEATARAKQLPRHRQRFLKLGQLVVDGDAQGLEGPAGGMAAGERRVHGRG